MLSEMKGSYFNLIAAKRVYSENQFYESPLSTKGSSMQPSNLKRTSKRAAKTLIHAGYQECIPLGSHIILQLEVKGFYLV